MAPVNNGDKITTDISDRSTVITIQWNQSLRSREESYYSGKYENVTNKGQSGQIFVQKNKLAEFERLASNGEMSVNDAFQYGQKNPQGEFRWIVFHNKDNKPYQHRFVNSVLKTLGQGGQEILNRIGLDPSKGELMKLAENIFGDYLHTF